MDGREGEWSTNEKKKKKRRTGVRLAFVSGRARRARVKNGGQLPLAFTSERVPHVPVERRGTLAGTREKKKRKKRKILKRK